MVGGGLAGAGVAAATGENIGEGLIRGVAGGALQGVGGDGALGSAFKAAGNTVTGGGDLRDAATAGAFSGLFTKGKELFKSPSEAVVGELAEPDLSLIHI